MVSQQELAYYYRQIQNEIASIPDGKEKVLEAIKSDVDDYLATNPSASMSDIIHTFGTPDMYTKEYLGSLDTSELYQKLKDRQFNSRILLFSAIIVILLVAVMVLGIILQNNGDVIKYYSEDIIDGATQYID